MLNFGYASSKFGFFIAFSVFSLRVHDCSDETNENSIWVLSSREQSSQQCRFS